MVAFDPLIGFSGSLIGATFFRGNTHEHLGAET